MQLSPNEARELKTTKQRAEENDTISMREEIEKDETPKTKRDTKTKPILPKMKAKSNQ